MNPSPVGSFTKFTVGFLVFIALGLGITIAVNVYTGEQDQQHQTAAAIQAMLQQGK